MKLPSAIFFSATTRDAQCEEVPTNHAVLNNKLQRLWGYSKVVFKSHHGIVNLGEVCSRYF